MSRLSRIRQASQFVWSLNRDRLDRWYAGRFRGDDLARLRLAEGRADPYKIYGEMRAKGQLLPTRLGGLATASHTICNQVLRSRDFGVREAGVAPSHGRDEFDLSFLGLNPPDHTRLRRLAQPAFSRKMMTAYEARIEKTVHALLDAAEQRGEFDLVADFAAPLPIAVITEMMGVPDTDLAAFKRYGAALGGALDGLKSLRHAREVITANHELERIFESLFELRTSEPREDLISALVAERGTKIQPAELVPMCSLLLIAGFETTVNLIGNGALALLRNPEQWELLVADPSLAARCVEEVLRYDPPVQETARVSYQDTEIAGVPVQQNQWIVTLIGGANRDPEVYADPDRFDLMRVPEADHLAFSSGIHYCVGSSLARLEATVAFRVLAERMPRLRQTTPVVMRPTTTIRGPLRMPVSHI